MIAPPRLGPGARVALIAPAGPVDDAKLETALTRCGRFGFEARLGRHARSRLGYLAGADDGRADDLRWAIEDPHIDAIWALRGGYGTMRLLPGLDVTPLRRRPKVFIGFSDNTTLHLLFARAGLISFHAPHAGGGMPPLTEQCFRRVLFEPAPAGALPLPDEAAPHTLRGGRAAGRLIGGNLAMLAACCGTPCALDARDAILVLEDVGEAPYRLDRMLTQLRLCGALEHVAGIGLGQFTEWEPAAGEPTIDELFADRLGELGVPILGGLPFGHVDVNWTLPFGARAVIDADAGTLTVIEGAVT